MLAHLHIRTCLGSSYNIKNNQKLCLKDVIKYFGAAETAATSTITNDQYLLPPML